jgi:hypothetical protein
MKLYVLLSKTVRCLPMKNKSHVGFCSRVSGLIPVSSKRAFVVVNARGMQWCRSSNCSMTARRELPERFPKINNRAYTALKSTVPSECLTDCMNRFRLGAQSLWKLRLKLELQSILKLHICVRYFFHIRYGPVVFALFLGESLIVIVLFRISYSLPGISLTNNKAT